MYKKAKSEQNKSLLYEKQTQNNSPDENITFIVNIFLNSLINKLSDLMI